MPQIDQWARQLRGFGGAICFSIEKHAYLRRMFRASLEKIGVLWA